MALPAFENLVEDTSTEPTPSFEKLVPDSPELPPVEKLVEDQPSVSSSPDLSRNDTIPPDAPTQQVIGQLQQEDAYPIRLQELQTQYDTQYLPAKRMLDQANRFYRIPNDAEAFDIPIPPRLQEARDTFAEQERLLLHKQKEVASLGGGSPAPILDEKGVPFKPTYGPYEHAADLARADEQAKSDAEKKRQENIRILGREPRWWETFPQAVKGIAQDALVEGMRTFQNSNIWDAEKTQQMAMVAHDTNVIAGLGKGIPHDIARGTADVLALMAGNPAGKAGILTAAFKGAELARARTFDETGDENKANAAALNSIITLPILLATGQAASKFASGLLPEGASALKVGATELAAGATANVGTDLLIHAVEGQPYDWRSFTADALFALHGAWSRFGEAAKAKGDTAGAQTAEQATQTVENALEKKGLTKAEISEKSQNATARNTNILHQGESPASIGNPESTGNSQQTKSPWSLEESAAWVEALTRNPEEARNYAAQKRSREPQHPDLSGQSELLGSNDPGGTPLRTPSDNVQTSGTPSAEERAHTPQGRGRPEQFSGQSSIGESSLAQSNTSMSGPEMVQAIRSVLEMPNSGEAAHGARTLHDLLSTGTPAEKEANKKKIKEIAYALSNSQTARIHGDVLNPEGPSQSAGEVPANEGGAGVPPRGQGENVAAPAPKATPQEVAPKKSFRELMDEQDAKEKAQIAARQAKGDIGEIPDYTPAIKLPNGKVVKATRVGEGHGELSNLFPDQKVTHGFVSRKTGEFLNLLEVSRDIQKSKQEVPPQSEAQQVTPPEHALGPGAANIEEFTPAPVMGTKNAEIDRQRAERGLEPLVSEARKPDPVLWDQAMQRIERDERAPDQLVAQVNAGKQKTATDVEQTMLLWKIVDLHNKMDTEAQRALDPHADEGDRVEARLRYDQLEQERQSVEEADRKVGTEQGRALRARRLMADENYNFVGLMRRAAVASREPITPEQTVQIKADAEKVKAAKDKLDAETAKVEGEKEIAKVKGTKAEVPLDEQRAKIAAHLEAEQKKGTPAADLKSFIQKLTENFVKSGVTEINALTTAVHGVVEPIFKGITPREVRDLFSGYGEFHALNPDPIKTELRRLRSEGQSVSKLEDVQGGKAPSKTGVERQPPSDLKRRLEKEVRETMKKNGITTTDPATQLKSSLDARKTAMKNQIKDLTYQIETGEKPKAGEPPPSDAELEGLRKLRDNVRETLRAIEGDPQMSDEQRAKLVIAQLDRQIAEHQRIINNGAVRQESGKLKPLSTPEIEARKAVRDSLKAQVDEIKAADQTAREEREFDATMKRADELEKKLASGDLFSKGGKELGPDTELVAAAKDRLAALRDQLKAARAASPEATQAKLDATKAAVEESIAKLDKRIQAEDFSSSKKALPTTPEIEALRAERDAMRRLFNELKSATLPKLTPEQRAQKALMTRLTKRTAELTAKLAAGDFTKPAPRTPTPLTPALVKAKADYERVKLDVDRGIEKLRLKNRTKFEKLADATAKWVRFGVLTGYSTLEKLTGAAIARVALNVPEEMVGSVARRVFPGVAARAPLEGRGFEPGVEAKALASGLTQGWKDAFKLLSTGHSDLDAAFGHRDVAPRSWMDFVGSLHGALKSNVKRTFFTRAQEKLLLDAAAKGRDITDPMVQTQIAMEAYKEANRSIFLNSNRIVEGFQAMLARWAAPDSKTGKVSIPGKIAQTAAKVLVPVVRIPANIVAETLGQYAGGLLHGIPRAIKAELAIRKGASDLSPVEADAIMRSLKKGSIGTSLLLLGFFGYKNVGGYYAPGQKRDENKEPNFGEAQIFGFKIPKAFLHNPALEAIQLGATVRRVADSKLRKSDTEKQGLMTGIGRALLAASEEVPFIGEAMHLGDLKEAHGGEKFLYNQARTFTEPQILQQLAKYFDKDKSGKPVKRQEKSLMDVLKGGIPGLRQTVPVKR